MSGNESGDMGRGRRAGKGNGRARAGAGADREAALQRALNQHGFHLVDEVEDHPANESDAPTCPVAPCAEDEEPRGARTFPCLQGCTYTGCLGLACPLDTCWTGGATVSFAAKARERRRISAGLYTPGAPCHSCACVRDSAIDAPLYRRPEHADAGPEQSDDERDGASDADEAGETGKSGEATGMAPARGVCCGKGLWAHPISLSAFVLKRIPMCEQDAPERCPGYEPRAEPHPAVAEHRRQRREQARRKRAERKPED